MRALVDALSILLLLCGCAGLLFAFFLAMMLPLDFWKWRNK